MVDTPIEKYLNEGLTAELASVGVETVPVADNIPTIEGKAVIFFGWTTRSTSSFNAAVNIEVSISTDKRLRFFRSYFAKKLGSKLAQACELLLKDATAEVMGAAAADIRKFLIKEAPGE